MPPRAKRRRTLCINCNACINTFRRYLVLDLNPSVISLLSEWISPVIITENDYICSPCNELLVRTTNQELSTDGTQASGASPHPGRRQNVCGICGRSILNRQSHTIVVDNPSLEQTQINDVIQTRIEPRQISSINKICHSCWMSCKSAGKHKIEYVDVASGLSTNEGNETGYLEPIKAEPRTEIQEIPAEVRSTEITLDNYRRAPNTASHCLFPECTNTTLHNITDTLRATILSSYKYYIPVHSRVCTEHKLSNEWNNLYGAKNSIRTFTKQQVEHIFSFVNAFNSGKLNFTNVEAIEEIDDSMFLFWTGISKQDFFSIISGVPRIQTMHNGILGLAALLIKSKTGETDVKLSTLLDVPRSTLHRLMAKCGQILVQDSVPTSLPGQHMISNLPRENVTTNES